MKALVLCGGIPQIAMIKELKTRGIKTILLDMNEKVPARNYADKFYPVSVLDVEAVKRVAIDEYADLVLTVCADQVLQVSAQISEELGLPCYIDFATAKKVSDKSDMKDIFVAKGIPTSQYAVSPKLKPEMVNHMTYPLIVKPVDSYSSRGVKKVSCYKEAEKAFEEAVNISRSKAAIIEEFVEGKELSVDVYVENGEAHVLCISQLDKIPGANRFVINRCSCPAPITEAETQMVQDTCQRIAEAFQLKDTPVLVQLITTGEKISVLEFCARTGGGDKFRLIKKMTGFDVVKAVVDLTLGIKPHVGKISGENKYITDEFLYCNPGIVDHFEGFDELVRDGIITEYFKLRAKGAEVHEPSCSGDRVAYVTIQADDLATLKKYHKKINETLKIVDPNGVDLLRHDLISKYTLD